MKYLDILFGIYWLGLAAAVAFTDHELSGFSMVCACIVAGIGMFSLAGRND